MLALVTNALAAPKYTKLLLAVASKPVPVIVTTLPASALVGVNEVIDGGATNTDAVTEIVAEQPLLFK